MAIVLNHTVVPTHDKEAPARFFAELFGLKPPSLTGCGTQREMGAADLY